MATKILFTGDSITDAFRTAICQDVERWVPPEQREAVRDKGLQVSFKLVELYEELKNWLAPGA